MSRTIPEPPRTSNSPPNPVDKAHAQGTIHTLAGRAVASTTAWTCLASDSPARRGSTARLHSFALPNLAVLRSRRRRFAAPLARRQRLPPALAAPVGARRAAAVLAR